MKRSGPALILSALAIAACVPDAAPESGVDPAPGETVPVIDGRYDLRPEQCGDPNSETRMTVQGDGFSFYESRCTFGRKGGQSGASEGVMICLGEGRRFTRDVRLENREGGLSIHENGSERAYSRCPSTAS